MTPVSREYFATIVHHRSVTALQAATVARGSRQPKIRGLTYAWGLAALFVPVYRSLPGSFALGWFGLVAAIIAATFCLGLAARPTFTYIWIVSGYAALVAIGTATESATPLSNARVGLQLFVLLGLCAFTLAGAVRRDPRFYPTVGVAFLIGQTFSSLAAIIQLTGRPVLGFVTLNDRSPGLAGHPNVLGLMSAIGLILCLTAFVNGTRRTLTTGVAAINIGGLLATGSLSSMTACGLGLLIAAIAFRVRLTAIVQTIAIALVTFWLATSFTDFGANLRSPGDRFLQVTGQTEAVSTLEIRNETYEYAWNSILHNPWAGVGLSANNAASFDSVTVVHNVFLRAWFQGGILLAVAIALIIGAAVYVAIKSVATRTNGTAAGVLVAVMFFALTSAFFEQPYYWLPVILAFVSYSKSQPSTTTPVQGPTPCAARPSDHRTQTPPLRARESHQQ